MPHPQGWWAYGQRVVTAASKRRDTFSVHYKGCVCPCGCHISSGVPVHPVHRALLRVADFQAPSSVNIACVHSFMLYSKYLTIEMCMFSVSFVTMICPLW